MIVRLILLLVVVSLAFATDPLPTARSAAGTGSWNGLVGVSGGIPTRTTIYQSFSPGATAAQINTALAACPDGQVVYLNAGTYNIGEIVITNSNTTLRGAGPTETIINSSGDGVTIGNVNWYTQFETPVSGNHRAISSGYSQGSSTIVVSSNTGMVVGNLIFIDQVNDADTTQANPSGTYTIGEYTSVAHPLYGYDRTQFQINRIASISGTTIGLTEPIYMPNWASGQSPEAWFITGVTIVEGCGVEDMAINSNGGDTAIQLSYCYGCWAKNCSLSIGTTEHLGYVFMVMCVRPEVRHNYCHDTGVYDRYGIHTRMVAGLLCEDNIVNGHSTILMVNGVSGSVYAYNYGVNNQSNSGFQVQGLLTHGGFPNMCLFEGNYTPQFGLDNTWGGSAYMLSFRNRHTAVTGPSTATGNIQAVAVMATHRHATVIGGVLGTTGLQTWYQSDHTTTSHDGTRVYYLGMENPAGTGGAYDQDAIDTLLRAVNWDSANGAIVGGGYTTNDLPNSYYLTSKPTIFGILSWPAFDPNNPTWTETAIPAGYRYVNGNDPPAAGSGGSTASGKVTISGNASIK